MAENPQQDPVYDDHEFPLTSEHPASSPTIQQLRKDEGINSTAGGRSGGSTSSTSAGSGGSTTSTQGDTPVSTGDLADRESGGGLYNSSATGGGPGGVKYFFWGTSSRRRRTIFGSIGSFLIGGGIFGATILSGPGQLIQLSQILQRNFTNSENTSSTRSNNLLRYAGANDVGETRVGLLGRQYLRTTFDDLSDIGIELQTNANSGLRSATIDPDKLAANYPELNGMSPQEQADYLTDQLKLSPGDVTVLPDGKTLSVDASDFPLKSVSALKGNLLGLLGDGTIATALKNRLLGDYLGLPSLFHPLSRALESKYNQLLNEAQRQSAVEDEEAAQAAPTEAEAEPAVEAVDGSGFNGGLAGALTATGGACFVYSTAKDVETIDHYRIVLPAVIAAANLIAVGEQVKSGQDLSASQAGAVEESLTDSQGQNVWQGQALQATEGNASPSGPDISGQYKQAFSGQGTPEAISKGADDVIHDITLGTLGASFVCSAAGTVIQIAITLSAGAIGAISDAVSGGALTPVDSAALVAFFGAKEAANVGESAISLHFLQNFVVGKTTDATLAKDAFSGPAGGDLLAYGARAAAGIGSIAEGGVKLAGSATAALTYQQQQQDERQFRSEGFFARMFDIDDSRSLLGKLADSINPSFIHNVASATSGIVNIGSGLLSNLSSIFLPKSQAASAPYDWGSPEYGIPASVLNNPAMADPYANADDVAQVLDTSGCLNTDGTTNSSCPYISRAMTCFGVNIVNAASPGSTTPIWDVMPGSIVDTSSSNYANASPSCDDLSDPNWPRIMLFVFDTRTMQAIACYQGDDTSCSDVGASDSTGGTTGTGPGGSTGAGTTTPVSGNAQRLAQQILANNKISLEGTDVAQDVQDAANGQPGTAGVPTSSAILKLIATVGQSHSVVITAIQSGGTGHCIENGVATPKSACPDDPHYNGDAVDFGELDGTLITGRNPPAITIMQLAFPLLPSGSGFGQNECGSQYSTNAELPDGDITFNDTCNHLHVQVPAGTP